MKPLIALITMTLLLLTQPGVAASETSMNGHEELVALFADWRAFEEPPVRDGAPDYTEEAFAHRQPQFEALRKRLHTIDISGWPVSLQVDWHIIRAEMNGYDFNRRILRPWARDPAFYQTVWTYQSDVPAHEGPTHHAVLELWQYDFPLSEFEHDLLVTELGVIPPLNEQARKNLTGNARELWVAGIRNIRQQSTELDRLRQQVGPGISEDLDAAIEAATTSTNELVAWLESEADQKTGPSGIGRDNYTWYQQNVHLVPLGWEDEVRLLKRELHRAWSSLKLEEHRNRKLPEARAASTPEEYAELAEQSAQRFMAWLKDEEILTVRDYMAPALRRHLGEFVPEDRRNFFWIAAHYDPTPLYSHFYHWFELAREEHEPHPSPVRQKPLLYNIFDSRNEGTATGVEEMFMHAGLYDEHPRSRELVWIMLAQRAARGLGSLYAHANEMTMEEAGRIHQDWTPRGWMKTEEELLIFEQHLYLRQPGYGTSYVTGKYLLEQTLADYAQLQESEDGAFRLKSFFDELNAIGSIPISLGRWEMTGRKAKVLELGQKSQQGRGGR